MPPKEVFSLYIFDFPNGKSYIGISKEVEARWRKHQRNAERGKDIVVARAIQKYGWGNVARRVLAVGHRDYICALEIAAISTFKTLAPHGYNITYGGDTAPSSAPEVREKIRQSKLRHWSDPEYRKRRVTWATGRKMTPEQNEKNRQAKLRHWRDPAYREKLVAAHTGLKDSEETKARKSASISRSWANTDRRKNFTAKMTGRMWANNGIEMRQLRKGEPIPNGWERGMLKKGR